MIYAFTSATKSYLPKVRVLSNSLAKYHPEICFIIGMADVVPVGSNLSGFGMHDTITVEQLKMPSSWIFQHSIVELSTAIKPFIFKKIMELDDCDAILYFDPDIVVYSQLNDLVQAFDKNSILLVPHLTQPDVWSVPENELIALQFGIYNLGFLGVKNDTKGKQFVNWWAKRLERYCFDDRNKGLFTDQKWADLVPALFEGVAILKSSRFDVASWNAPTRSISRFGNTIMVDGNPIGFYHFTGFDSGAHDIALSKGVNSDNPLWDLVKQYRIDIGKPDDDSWAYDYFNNGFKITPEHRRLYRNRPDLQRTFPNPFEADGSRSYFRWFKTNGKRGLRPQMFTADRLKKGWKLFVKNPRQAVRLARAFITMTKS
jgi:hypothetical protein